MLRVPTVKNSMADLSGHLGQVDPKSLVTPLESVVVELPHSGVVKLLCLP